MKLRYAAALALVCTLQVPAPGGPNSLLPDHTVFNIPNMAACEAELEKFVSSYEDATQFCKCGDNRVRPEDIASREPRIKSR